MNLNSHSQNQVSTQKFSEPIYSSLPFSEHINPDISMLMEVELKSPTTSSSKNIFIYFICGLASLTFASLGLWIQFQQTNQALNQGHNNTIQDTLLLGSTLNQ